MSIWDAIILIDKALLGLRRDYALGEIASIAKGTDGVHIFARTDLNDVEGFCL